MAIAPPGPQRRRRALVIRASYWLLALIAATGLVTATTTADPPIFAFGGGLFAVGMLPLLARRSSTAAAHLLCVATWLLLFAAVARTGGILHPLAIAGVAVAPGAVLLVGRRGAAAWVLLSALGFMALAATPSVFGVALTEPTFAPLVDAGFTLRALVAGAASSVAAVLYGVAETLERSAEAERERIALLEAQLALHARPIERALRSGLSAA